jgi:hypothetical protein
MEAGRRSLEKPVADRRLPEKAVCICLLASPVGEQIGDEKLAVLLSPWQPLVKLSYPGGIQHTIKVGRGHTGYQSKS